MQLTVVSNLLCFRWNACVSFIEAGQRAVRQAANDSHQRVEILQLSEPLNNNRSIQYCSQTMQTSLFELIVSAFTYSSLNLK